MNEATKEMIVRTIRSKRAELNVMTDIAKEESNALERTQDKIRRLTDEIAQLEADLPLGA